MWFEFVILKHPLQDYFVLFQCTRANPCYDSDKCENLVPGYQCAACPAGYRGNAPSGVGLKDAQNSTQNCEEIDECKEGISTCDPNAQCINTNVRTYEIYERYKEVYLKC